MYNIGSQQNGMHGIGTPDDLQFFLSHQLAAAGACAKNISHRGYWQDASEKQRTFVAICPWFGTETDVRDCEQLVISHDMPTGNELL